MFNLPESVRWEHGSQQYIEGVETNKQTQIIK